jgi:hypothetical protein
LDPVGELAGMTSIPSASTLPLHSMLARLCFASQDDSRSKARACFAGIQGWEE